MVLIVQLAWRYLRGKRAGNAVPILSRISMVAIAVASCAMIVLFSVFNGFESLIKDLYKAFYPELKITLAKGKFFALDAQQLQKLQSLKGVSYYTKVIEDNVLLTGNDEQQVATLKGIDQHYFQVNNVKPYIYEGRDAVSAGTIPTAIIGLQIANRLGLDVNNAFSRLTIYYPNTAISNPAINPQDALQSLQLKPDGTFMVQDEFDSKIALAPLALAQYLFRQQGRYSSIELALNGTKTANEVKAELQQQLGTSYTIATRYEQNKTLYMVMKTEKWAVYAILVLVLLIASFNMVGALSLLVLEKQKDIAILRAMGAEASTVQKIFITEGLLWALTGGGLGLMIGALICLGQQHFQWIKLQGSFIIEAYPVVMQWTDFVLIIVTVALVGLLAAWYPASRATIAQDPTLKAA